MPRDLRPSSMFGFSIKRKMDNTKEIGKTCHGLNSTYNALKPIHDKSLSIMVRATMVSMQHGLMEVRNTVLIGLPFASQRFPPLPTRSTLTHLPNSTPYPTVPMTVLSCKKL